MAKSLFALIEEGHNFNGVLFELALAEFRSKGTARARIRDIVGAAGVVPGTFYFHFPTKDHVLFELWLRNSRRLVDRLPDLDVEIEIPGEISLE